MKNAIKIFKALSDETRIRLYRVLQEKKELCVCQILQALDMSQTRVSRNLGMLKSAGLIKDRREGKFVYYYINGEMKDVDKFISSFVEDDDLLRSDIKKIKKVKHAREMHK